MSQRDMIDEGELRDLFAPRQPNAEAFAQGVAARIERAQQPPANQNGLGKVATFAPFPAATPKVLLWLSLPVVLLAGTWLAMFSSARSIGRALDRQKPAAPIRPLLTHLIVGGLQFVAIFASLIFSLMGWPYLLDGLIAMILVSMLSLTLVVHVQARAGTADRPSVARLCVGLLEIMLTMTVVYSIFGLAGIDDAKWMPFAAGTIALALLILIRHATARVLASFWSAGFLILLTQFEPWQISSMNEKPPTVEQAQAFVSSPELEVRDSRLEPYGAIVASLRDAGIAIEPTREWLRLSQGIAGTLSLDAHAITRLAYAGLVPDSAWSRIAANGYVSRRLRELVREDGPLDLNDYDAYRLAAFAHSGASAEQRDHVIERIEQSWPTRTSRGAMKRCRLLTAGLDWLDRSDLADGHRELVHDLLVQRQQQHTYRRGGFAERPATGDYGALPADIVAIGLIRRFGLPAELDVHALRGHLQRRSKMSPSTTLDTIRDDAFVAFAHLLYLDSLGPSPERSLTKLLLEERTFFAVLSMVLLCLFAVFRAPARIKPTAIVLP